MQQSYRICVLVVPYLRVLDTLVPPYLHTLRYVCVAEVDVFAVWTGEVLGSSLEIIAWISLASRFLFLCNIDTKLTWRR